MHAILLRTGVVSTGSDEDANDFASIAAISFSLTVLNIACIWVAGLVMFEIKEVAPTESKGAFWERDIKLARELNRKGKTSGDNPPPVDFRTLARGLKSALSRKHVHDPNDDSAPIDAVKIQPPRVRTHHREASLDSAFAFQSKQSIGRLSVWEEEQGETARKGDNVQYVGLDDMPHILGFDKVGRADVDSIDSVGIARMIGKGRYI